MCHKRIPPVETDGAEGIRFCQPFERRDGTPARRQISSIDAKGVSARVSDDRGAICIGKSLGHAQAEAHRMMPLRRWLQRAIPARMVDIDRPDLDAVLPRVAHELGRRIEAHGLGIQEGAAEHVRMVAFHPGRGIGDQREGGRMAFGKAIGAEAFELLEDALGEFAAS